MNYKKTNQTVFSNYELLDSGNEKKLERFGKYTFVRPDYQALWNPKLEDEQWQSADAILEEGRNWNIRREVPEKWEIQWNDLKFYCKLTPFGHIGIFPEQSDQWSFIEEKTEQNSNILSLFSYTGLSTLAACIKGKVCHVDASKPAIAWARENQILSKLEERPIRWILDDGLKFVKREIKRNAKYDGIIMDPPKFGRGPKGEVWKFEDDFMNLLLSCKQILSADPKYFIITAYAISLSSISLGQALEDLMKEYGGTVEYGDLGLAEQNGDRFLPQAIFARWYKS